MSPTLPFDVCSPALGPGPGTRGKPEPRVSSPYWKSRFERARLQSCRKLLRISRDLAPAGLYPENLKSGPFAQKLYEQPKRSNDCPNSLSPAQGCIRSGPPAAGSRREQMLITKQLPSGGNPTSIKQHPPRCHVERSETSAVASRYFRFGGYSAITASRCVQPRMKGREFGPARMSDRPFVRSAVAESDVISFCLARRDRS